MGTLNLVDSKDGFQTFPLKFLFMCHLLSPGFSDSVGVIYTYLVWSSGVML